MQAGDKIERLKEQVHRLVQRNKELEEQSEVYRLMAKDLDRKIGEAYAARSAWEEATRGICKALEAQEATEFIDECRDPATYGPADWARVRA